LYESILRNFSLITVKALKFFGAKASRKMLMKWTKVVSNVIRVETLVVSIDRVLLDWIAGLLNPDCNPIWWIGL